MDRLKIAKQNNDEKTYNDIYKRLMSLQKTKNINKLNQKHLKNNNLSYSLSQYPYAKSNMMKPIDKDRESF